MIGMALVDLIWNMFSQNVTYEPPVLSGRLPTNSIGLTRTSSLYWRGSVLSLDSVVRAEGCSVLQVFDVVLIAIK